MKISTLTRTAVAAALALTLAACGSTSSTGAVDTTAPGVTAAEAWVKAVDSGMTAAFLTLTNSTDKDLTLVKASTPAAGMVELHEMAMKDGQMVMQPKAGGIPVKAGSSAVLEPGGDHIMLMQLAGPVKVGDDVELTLTFDDGTTLEVTAPAKAFDGGNESYEPSPSGSMSM